MLAPLLVLLAPSSPPIGGWQKDHPDDEPHSAPEASLFRGLLSLGHTGDTFWWFHLPWRKTAVALRARPSRHDTTAVQFLSVAADLLDAFLQADPVDDTQPQRLGHISFPTALDWLRTDDVIRLAPSWSGEAARRRAFFSRWATRGDFLADAVVYALLREQPAIPSPRRDQDVPLSRYIADVTDDLLTNLVHHPRSYLVLHLAPLLPRHPNLAAAFAPGSRPAAQAWAGVYRRLADGLDLVLRPEWTFKRLTSVLQAMVDGFVLRHRVEPRRHQRQGWQDANMLADAVIALLLGAVDWDLTGMSGRAAIDRFTTPQPVRPF
ncbi:hypothetical protein [Actinophytocola sp. NPDC049390]|uniref:hypothetical protein n=1 Tax=Actinophytocola sp. NPDC049390 TaxID=3363894 RepID=UPI00379FD3A4